MKRNLLNETPQGQVYRYIKCLGFTLKFSDYKLTVTQINGFIDALYWSHFIDLRERNVLQVIAKSCCKSIRRHYRKEGKLYEI